MLRSRRAVIVASVVAAVLAVGGVTAAVAAGNGGVAEPDLPSLPQPLDQHVDDLWKEVGQ